MDTQLSTESPGSRSPVSLATSLPSARARPRHATLAVEACKAFSEGRWEDCIEAIHELKTYIPQREAFDEEGNESAETDNQTNISDSTRLEVNEIVARREAGSLSVVQTVKALDALYAVGKESQANGNLDVCDQVVLLYNLALGHFLRKQYLEADKLLKKVLTILARQSSSSPGGSSVNGNNSNTILHNHVYPLLASVNLALRLPTEALVNLGHSLSSDGNQSPVSNLSGRQMLCRAHALILSRQHKPFKRDLKPVGLTPDETVAFELMRANMEFLKGNHKKSAKLILLAIKNRTKEHSLPLDVSALCQNNYGCLHVMINKPNLATHYLTLALHEHERAINEENFSRRADLILQVKQFEITYNLGIALLHSKRYIDALKTLLKTVKFLKESAHLWYHMAECCIMACSRDEDSIRELQKLILTPGKYSLIIGGRNQQSKRGAVAVNLSASSSPVTEEMQGDSDACSSSPTTPEALVAVPRPSMLFACLCLRNASSLIEKRMLSPAGPNELPMTTRLGQLKSAVLVAQSFVSLCLEDYTSALSYARQLLRMDPGAPSGYVALAHLYAAEALICMERISEAMAHLEPKIIHDVSFEEVREATDEAGGSPVVANSAAIKRQAQHVNGNNNNNNISGPVSTELLSTKVLFTFNLALAQLLRGESERAEEMLDKLWLSVDSLKPTSVAVAGPGHNSFATRLIMAKLFINLRKGNLKKCREIVKETCELPAKKDK